MRKLCFLSFVLISAFSVVAFGEDSNVNKDIKDNQNTDEFSEPLILDYELSEIIAVYKLGSDENLLDKNNKKSFLKGGGLRKALPSCKASSSNDNYKIKDIKERKVFDKFKRKVNVTKNIARILYEQSYMDNYVENDPTLIPKLSNGCKENKAYKENKTISNK